jgi:hypothetical protein
LLACLVLAGVGAGCGPDSPADDEAGLERARVLLGASFVGGQARGIEPLLHQDLIVQPPAPDSAVGRKAASAYIVRLARETRVSRSELVPVTVAREGEFLLEQGSWFLESAARRYRSRYTIRWRSTPTGWQVVLWRWTSFR